MTTLPMETHKPLRLWTGRVLAEWLDYNGHMTEHRYLQVFGESSDALYAQVGVDFDNADNGAFYTVATHILHLAECKLGTALWSDTEILGYDDKRIHLYHRLFDGSGTLLATGEHLAMHVKGSKACATTVEKVERIAAIFAQRCHRVAPEGTGSVLKRELAHMRPKV